MSLQIKQTKEDVQMLNVFSNQTVSTLFDMRFLLVCYGSVYKSVQNMLFTETSILGVHLD